MTSDFTPYPNVPLPEEPFGIFVLVQLKKPQTKTKGGIILTDESKETDQYMVDRGIVRAVGSMAFRYRDSGEPWPGGWPKVGDEVRVPMYGGVTFWTDEKDDEKKVRWAVLKDNECLTRIRRVG